MVVTGAARSLGEVIARHLHGRGDRVVIADLNVEAARAVAADLDPSGATALAVGLDVREKESFEALIDQVTAAWGPIQVVVNNAARTQATALMEISPEEFRAVIDVNVTGTFLACQVFGQHLAEQGHGRIINLGSLAGHNGGTSTGGHYAASKGAIHTLTKVFARELSGRGVTVNAIAPGPLESPLVQEVVPPEKMVALLANIPVGRIGTPEFIAEVVALLASESAGFVSGACWDVNGGLFMR